MPIPQPAPISALPISAAPTDGAGGSIPLRRYDSNILLRIGIMRTNGTATKSAIPISRQVLFARLMDALSFLRKLYRNGSSTAISAQVPLTPNPSPAKGRGEQDFRTKGSGESALTHP